MMTIGETLKKHWLRGGVRIEDGVSESELTAFENKYSIHLPEDLRDYFSFVNGMPDGYMDDAWFRFWTLNEIEPLSKAAPEYAGPDYIDVADSVFLFADFMIWSHAFAIRLSPEKEKQSNTVYVIGFLPAIPIASSFSEFVEIYLTDNDRLAAV